MFGGDGPRLDQVEALAAFGAWPWNVQKNELVWSAGLGRILGIGDAPASFELWLSRVHHDDLSTVKAYFTRLRKEHGAHAIEYRLAGEPTRTIHARARSGADGVVHGVDQDITQTKETAARVVFSDRMVSIGTLAGGVAHEINNPLAIISANLQMLGGNDPDPSLVDEALRAVERIKTIVRGLTAFSRSTDNDQRRSVDLSRVLDLACSLTGSAVRHRAKFTTELGPVPWVRADEARLGQVVINLLVNAMEAIPEGHANQHEVTLRARTDEAGWAIIEVSDTGGGIPSDVQPRVFDPFFTTKPVGQGTGLGLSICRNIIAAAGGTIDLESAADLGTTFTIRLPASSGAPTPNGGDIR
jgi:signal transduction histidine kinase